jgi:hypothetical protein
MGRGEGRVPTRPYISATLYVSRYELASDGDSGLFAGGGSEVVEDHFVLGSSGGHATTRAGA